MATLQQRIGERIRELRKAKGWSQEGFADICKLHRTYMGSVERGERNMTIATLQTIAQSLKISLSELLRGLG